MIPFSRSEIQGLIRIATSETGNVQITGLRKLWQLAEHHVHQETLCESSLKLIPKLKVVLENADLPTVLCPATGILWFLSRCSAGIRAIASPKIDLIPLILQLAQSPSPFQDHLINLLSNLTLVEGTHGIILAQGSLFFDLFLKEFQRRPEYFQLYKCIAGFTKVAKETNIRILICSGIHLRILTQLFSNGLEIWPGNSTFTWSLTFTTALSSSLFGAEEIRSYGNLEFFKRLMNEKSIRGIQATMILANVLRTEKLPVSAPLLTNDQSMLNLIVDLLDVTMDYDDNRPVVKKYKKWRFGYGVIQLRDISTALKNLSFREVNKETMLLHPTLLKLASKALRDFVDNREDYHFVEYLDFHTVSHGGGGGEDVDSMLNFLEMLVQLSFDQEGGNHLINMLRGSRLQLQVLLRDFLALPASRDIPMEATVLAEVLLSNLQNELKEPEISRK